ncbi:MAG: HAD-IA family hydrolase [Christensenellales bacterium]
MWRPVRRRRDFSACHFVKPEKEIYEKLIADCALTPERTLFIDDTLPNVEGAMKLGINGFHMHEKGMMDRFFL